MTRCSWHSPRPIPLHGVAILLTSTGIVQAAPPRQTAYETATVRVNNDANNVQQIPIETDYIPNVVQAENGAASMEALKAQAVAARSFLYYKLNDFGSIGDGQNDQVYTNGSPPSANHIAAAAATEREVMRWGTGSNDVTIAAFYVSGTRPSTSGTAPFGVAEAGDTPAVPQEQYVTYNRGLAGNNIDQTSLGFQSTPPSAFPKNRGGMSQNGSDFLSDNGWNYVDILRYYYGADIHLEVAKAPANGSKPALKTIGGFDVDLGYFGNGYVSPNNVDINSLSLSRVTTGTHSGSGAQRIVIDQSETTSGGFTLFHTAGLGPNSIAKLDGATAGEGIVGTAATNLSMESVGSIGFWLKAGVMAGNPSFEVQLLLDDDAGGTERSFARAVAADGLWHKFEWFLDDPADWFNFSGGNGTMDGGYFSIDSIKFSGVSDATFTIDDVFYNAAAVVVPEPQCALLFAAGLGLIGFSRRRQS